MNLHFSPDQVVLLQIGFFKVNSTLLSTWIVILVLTFFASVVTGRIPADGAPSRWQSFLEVIVEHTRQQLKELGVTEPNCCLPFVATIFVFIAMSTLLGVIPGFTPPTASLSTTAALAICVFFAVPYFGIATSGPRHYLRRYVEPTWLMAPFNIMGDLSRTVALSVRLFGNAMSETMIIAICLTIAPLIFPLFMKVLGLLTGMVQAYIFAVLAALYIAAGMRSRDRDSQSQNQNREEDR